MKLKLQYNDLNWTKRILTLDQYNSKTIIHKFAIKQRVLQYKTCEHRLAPPETTQIFACSNFHRWMNSCNVLDHVNFKASQWLLQGVTDYHMSK